MFNVYTFDKKIALAEDLKHLKADFLKEELQRKHKQNKLVASYKRRIENFVLQMSEKPVVHHDIVLAAPKFRDEDPSKFMGSPNFVIRAFKHEKDRIKEAMERNQEYQGDYVNSQAEFRERDTSKEIHPQMRFTTKSQADKLADRINNLLQSSRNSSPGKPTPKLDESLLKHLSKSPQATNKYVAQHILPELNMKTYFKSTESLYLSQPSASPTAKKPEQNTKNPMMNSEEMGDKDVDGMEMHSKMNKSANAVTFQRVGNAQGDDDREVDRRPEQKNPANEALNAAEVSKDVLLKCNIIKQKNADSHTLKRGEGHLMSMPDYNVGQIYNNVYHKGIDMKHTQ